MNPSDLDLETALEQRATKVFEALEAVCKARGRVPISQVHLVSTFASKMGEGGVKLIEKMATGKNRLRVFSTTDPTDIEPRYWEQLHYPQRMISQQQRLDRGLLRLGAIPTRSCTPYLDGAAPRFGEHIAWGESSAVIFANSVLGAMTNSTSVFEDLFAGFTGWVPRYGMHLKHERRGRVEINLHLGGREVTEKECGLIGYWIGTRTCSRIPVLTGFPRDPSLSKIITMLASAAIVSSLPLVHIVGVTPEARTKTEAFQGHPSELRLSLGPRELKEADKDLSTVSEGKVDGVIFGCPHYTLDQLRAVALMIKGRKIKKNILFWIMTTERVKHLAIKMGIDREIERAGIKLFVSTCCFHFPPESFGRSEVFMSDSGKGAYLIPSMIQKKVIFASTEECIEAAMRGEYSNRK